MTIPDQRRRVIRKPADRDAWLAVRAPFVGASECAVLVDENEHYTVSQLALRKIRNDGYVKPDSPAMRRGRHLEAAVANWWEEENGVRLFEPEVVYVWDNLLVATLDRLVVGADVAVEIKTTTDLILEPKRSWYWQCQCQMLCAGLERVELVVLDPTFDLKTFTIEPELGDQVRLVRAAENFWTEVRAGRVPRRLMLAPYRKDKPWLTA